MIRVTVVVISLNEEENIGRCLESVTRQTFPRENIEIIVVDNHSSDNTVAIARTYTDLVFIRGPERSPQKNFGVEQSRGTYILHLDGDMMIPEGLIQECYELCKRDRLVACYIPETVIGEGRWIQARNFERSFYDHTPITAPRFIRRETYLAVGGYDTALIAGEDWDLDRRLREKGPTGYVTTPLLHNEGKLVMGRFMKSRAYYARHIRKYIEKWGSGDPLVKKQLGFRYRYFGVYLEQGKWKKLVRHPVLAAEMYLIKVSTGLQYLLHRNG